MILKVFVGVEVNKIVWHTFHIFIYVKKKTIKIVHLLHFTSFAVKLSHTTLIKKPALPPCSLAKYEKLQCVWILLQATVDLLDFSLILFRFTASATVQSTPPIFNPQLSIFPPFCFPPPFTSSTFEVSILGSAYRSRNFEACLYWNMLNLSDSLLLYICQD